MTFFNINIEETKMAVKKVDKTKTKKGANQSVIELTARIKELESRGQGSSKMCEHLKKVLATKTS